MCMPVRGFTSARLCASTPTNLLSIIRCVRRTEIGAGQLSANLIIFVASGQPTIAGEHVALFGAGIFNFKLTQVPGGTET